MKAFVPSGVILLVVGALLAPRVSVAECTSSHEECDHPCIEYYENGTDCKKTKKVCHTVCDEFSVKKSGDTTEHQHQKDKPETPPPPKG